MGSPKNPAQPQAWMADLAYEVQRDPVTLNDFSPLACHPPRTVTIIYIKTDRKEYGLEENWYCCKIPLIKVRTRNVCDTLKNTLFLERLTF